MFESEPSSAVRSVTWSKQQRFSTAMSSAAILKAISTIGTMSSVKSKTGRRSSKAVKKWNPKLVFEYGPSSYRGLTLHRKIKIAPFAEHFQKKYPDLRVFYHPTDEYNRVCVKLLNNIVCKINFSNLAHTRFGNITSQPFYKLIDKAVQRVLSSSNSLTKPFRDPMCMMTHNLEIDYDYPWYRTQFPPAKRSLDSYYKDNPRISRNLVSFDAGRVTAMHCQVQWDNSKTSVKLWEKFKRKIERSVGYESMLNIEAPMPVIENLYGIKKEVTTRNFVKK